MKQQQHGDVLICRVDTVPADSKPVLAINGRMILADGEVTGHAHAITDAPNVSMHESPDGTLYLEVVDAPVEVSHEEHHTQTITPGIYEIGRVVEVDPFAEEVRQVAD